MAGEIFVEPLPKSASGGVVKAALRLMKKIPPHPMLTGTFPDSGWWDFFLPLMSFQPKLSSRLLDTLLPGKGRKSLNGDAFAARLFASVHFRHVQGSCTLLVARKIQGLQ
jgi:hypothetical protein